MFLIVSVSGNNIGYRTEYMGIGSTKHIIILWYEEFSSLNLNYVYNKVKFDGGKLEGDAL